MKCKDCIHYMAHKHFYFGEEDFDEYFSDDNVESQCPVCNGVLASGEIEKEDCTNIHYCENCGQAIDWSDT